MSKNFPHIFAATIVAALCIACARSDARPAPGAHAGGSSSVSGPASAAGSSVRSTTAGGTVATAVNGPAPNDSISDRADRGRILGDSTATVWLIMASDFQCPYCKEWHDTQFAGILKDYVKTGKVRLAFLNMPLSIHPDALPAAEAAMCASVQNKFWPMHEALFATQAAWEVLPDPRQKFDSIAASLGVNMTTYHTCVSQHLTLPLIQADHDRGHNAGVNSTPTFFVGGQTLAGSIANVRGAIDAALKGTPKPGR